MILGITLGDPGGIGPEVALKALAQMPVDGTRYRVYASRAVIAQPIERADVIWEWLDDDAEPIVLNQSSAVGGRYAVRFIQKAAEDAMRGKIDGIVTAPISKESLKLADYSYTGHTTLLKALTKSQSVSMAFHSEKLNVVLATIHHPLAKVPALITPKCLATAAENATVFMQKLGIVSPKIALAGLNPHAGENGLLGREELVILNPFVQKWNTENAQKILGPYPPDTVFYRASQGEFDMVIALYHDQGLIPLKLLAFDSAVNVSIGLPFVRTSPDHGTAFDIAYQDKASPNGMIAAIQLAKRWIHHGT